MEDCGFVYLKDFQRRAIEDQQGMWIISKSNRYCRSDSLSSCSAFLCCRRNCSSSKARRTRQ